MLGVQSGPGQVSILLGKGDGTFQTPTDYGVEESPNSIAISDFHRDGKLDLVLTNRLGDSIRIRMGNGDSTFQPAMNVVTLAEPTFVSW